MLCRLPEKTSDSTPFCSKMARFQIPKFDEINQSCVAFFSQEDEEQVVIKNVKNALWLKATMLLQLKQERNVGLADAAD